MRSKGILKLFGVCALGLVLTACGGKKDSQSSESAKLPISEQEAVSLIKDKKATPPGEDYSPEEIASIGQNEFFSHLENDSGAYANVLKYSYLKNLLYQDLKDDKGNILKVGSLIKDSSKPTLFMITRSNCPYCQEVLEDLTNTYNPKDFNLILAEGHLSEKEDIAEDVEGVLKETEALGNDHLKDYHAYGVDPLMDELHAVYYPTLIYLDSNGYIINVSGNLTYGEIMEVFEKTLGAKKDTDTDTKDIKEEAKEDIAKVESETPPEPEKAQDKMEEPVVGNVEKPAKAE